MEKYTKKKVIKWLIQDGYLRAIIPPVLRHEYIELLERAHRYDAVEQFIAERIIDSQKEIMRLLHIPIPKLDNDMDMKL